MYDANLNTNVKCTAVSATGCSFLNNDNVTLIPTSVRNLAFGMEVDYVPEPGSIVLLTTGLVFLGLRRRR